MDGEYINTGREIHRDELYVNDAESNKTHVMACARRYDSDSKTVTTETVKFMVPRTSRALKEESKEGKIWVAVLTKGNYILREVNAPKEPVETSRSSSPAPSDDSAREIRVLSERITSLENTILQLTSALSQLNLGNQ